LLWLFPAISRKNTNGGFTAFFRLLGVKSVAALGDGSKIAIFEGLTKEARPFIL
jgi:hypothetical protein